MSFIAPGGSTHRDFNLRIPGRGKRFGSADFFAPPALVPNTLTLSGGNRIATYSVASGAWLPARVLDRTGAQVYNLTDKRYFEIAIDANPANYIGIDVGVVNNAVGNNTMANPNGSPFWGLASCNQLGLVVGVLINGGIFANAAFAMTPGVVVGCAIDGPNSKMYISNNGVFFGGQDPVGGVSGITGFPAAACVIITTHDNGTATQHPVYTFSGGGASGALAFAPPTGYLPWNQLP